MSFAFVRRERCPVCDHGEHRTLLRRSFDHPSVASFLDAYYEGRIPPGALDAGQLEIARCDACGFLWQVEVLGDEGMAALYGEWIDAAHSLDKKRHGDVALFARYAREVEAVSRLVGRPARQVRVLDFGMGWGYWVRMAAAYGHPAVGWEIDPNRRAHARELGVRVLAGEAEIDDGGFGFINCEQVFEHLPRPAPTLRRLAAALAPGGVLRIAVPNALGSAGALGRPSWRAAKDVFHPLEHVNSFTNRTLRRLAAMAGLAAVRRQPSVRPPGPPRGARDLVKTLLGPIHRRHLGTELYFRRLSDGDG